MSKILVIEPRKILQQALRLALCPDHEVQAEANLSGRESTTVGDFDLAIIDAAALREVNLPSAQVLRAVEAWKIPKIWIDEAEGGQVPSRDALTVLIKPIEKDTLQAAVATCLGAAASQQNGTDGLSAKETTRSTRMTASDSSATAEVPIVDLVDVIEEPPAHNRYSRRQRKTK
jgi:DNA-binding NtrC family response regulator